CQVRTGRCQTVIDLIHLRLRDDLLIEQRLTPDRVPNGLIERRLDALEARLRVHEGLLLKNRIDFRDELALTDAVVVIGIKLDHHSGDLRADRDRLNRGKAAGGGDRGFDVAHRDLTHTVGRGVLGLGSAGKPGADGDDQHYYDRPDS